MIIEDERIADTLAYVTERANRALTLRVMREVCREIRFVRDKLIGASAR